MRSINPPTSAYDILRAEILHGNLMPGERLRVADLNTRYQLGLTPLREALVRLSSEGLVLNENNKGARVRDATIEEFLDLSETRRELERICLTLAMELGSAEWEGEILRSLHLLSRATLPMGPDDKEAAAQWEFLHRQFHWSLVSACGSKWRLYFWNVLVDQSEMYRKLRFLVTQPKMVSSRDIHEEHEALALAVIERNKSKALELVDLHLEKTEKIVATILKNKA